MVFNYTIRGGPCLGKHSNLVLSSSDITCYVGRDKHENEYLIKYGWPGDMWFHVDSLSSAHVYFRVCTDSAPVTGIPIDDLPVDSVYDMMQIVKHNSISGCKLASTRIVYTPHSNLKKTFEMDSGTVTYHDSKLCRYARCDKDRTRVKELEATKTERNDVDFYAEKQANARRIIERKKREAHHGEDDMEVYDPIKDDMRTGKLKATRVGDEESGLDKGLAALDGLSFAPVISHVPRVLKEDGDDGGDNDIEDAPRPDLPVWVDDANDRSLEPSSDVRFLRARGYSSPDATGAVTSNDSSIAALRTLWYATSMTSDSDADLAEATEAREEEKEVLKAIFEDDGVSFSEDDALFDAIFPITTYEPPPRYEAPPPLLLEVYVDGGIAPLYPHQPPVLALVGGGLPETLLKELTNRLRAETLERSEEMPGDPLIFTLLGFVGEEVERLIEEETADLEEKRKKLFKEQKEQAAKERKAEAERLGKELSDEKESLAFKTEAERRAYAKDVLSNVDYLKVVDDGASKKKQGGAARFNTGVTDESLINDMFG